MLSSEAILYYADHPVEFVEDIIKAKPDDKQAAILESVAKHPMTSVRSGHGIGKSAVEAWVVIWFLLTRPFPKIPCTAPTQHQLFDILWAEISKWKRNNPALGKEIIWTKEKIYLSGHAEEWFAVARTATTPDALQGFHAENVLYIIDEASGVKDSIFEPVLGSLSTDGAKLLMCGNPTQLSGFFYESHHKNRASYSTFHIDARNSSRVSRDFISTIVDMYGEQSNVFRVRVAGEFPKQEDDVFIPLPLVESAITNDLTPHNEAYAPSVIELGIDVARYGDDDSVIAAKVGGVVRDLTVRHGQDLMRTVGDTLALCYQLREEYNYQDSIYVKIDDTGLGGGVTDRLKEIKEERALTWLIVAPVNAAARVPSKYARYYDNFTTYMWAKCRDAMTEQALQLPNDDNLVAQFSCRKYHMMSSGKLRLESKDDMKKRGISSPDRADAVALACLPMKRKKGERDE